MTRHNVMPLKSFAHLDSFLLFSFGNGIVIPLVKLSVPVTYPHCNIIIVKKIFKIRITEDEQKNMFS